MFELRFASPTSPDLGYWELARWPLHRVLDPADELVACQRRDVLPGFQYVPATPLCSERCPTKLGWAALARGRKAVNGF